MDPQQAAVLQQLNRPGWKVTGQRPEVKSTVGPPDAYGQPTRVDQPTGNIVWVITGPGGQSDEIVVKPPAAPNVPYENANDPGAQPGAAGYTIVEGPKNNVQQPSTQTRSNYQHYTDPKTGQVYESWDGHPWSPAPGLPADTKASPTPAGGLETINDPTTGKPIKLRDPATGTVIDLPNSATPSKPQLVDGPNGSKYSWDGDKLTLQLAGTTPPAQPKEGDQYQAIESGRNVTKTYRSGNWVTTSVGDSAVPGTAKEGDTYQAIEGGNNVTKTYRGGQWVTTAVGDPVKPQTPTTLNTGTGPYIVQQTPDQATRGETTQIPNPNTTDVVARTQQLQNAARTKSNELQQAVQSGRTTPEQAASDFDSWWSTNVDPFSQQLQQSQQAQQYDYQTKQREQQRLEEAQQTQNLSTAQQAGRDVVSAYTSQDRNRVGPGYGQAFVNALNSWKTGKPAPDVTPDAVMYQAPDLNQMYEQAVARSLAHISPTAAAIAGRPMPQIPQGIDVGAALNKSSYAPRGTTLIHPDGTVEVKPPDQQPPTPAPAIPPYLMPNYTPAVAPF